jgi:histone H3/H4
MAKKKKVVAPMMVVSSKTKAFVAENFEKRMSGDFVEALNNKVAAIVEEAVGRCESNKRGTLRPQDL